MRDQSDMILIPFRAMANDNMGVDFIFTLGLLVSSKLAKKPRCGEGVVPYR